jgi:biopolymer transport protein ExbD
MAGNLNQVEAAPTDAQQEDVVFPERDVLEAEMDMTPMVDVTFLLLIFFMVTAAFSLQKSLQIPKPEPSEEAASRSFQELEDDPDYITVHVDEYGTYRVVTIDWDREAFSEAELLRQLKEARAGNTAGKIPAHLLVRANGEATHEKVVAALDSGTAVGMEDIQLITVEDDE